LIISFYFCWNI